MPKAKKKRNWKRVAGVLIMMPGLWVLLPPYFLPSEFEFYLLLLIPFIGIGAVILLFVAIFAMVPLGLWMLKLPMNGKGVKKAMKKMKAKRKKKKK